MWSKFAMGIIIVVLALTITGTLAKYTYTFDASLGYLGSQDSSVVNVYDDYDGKPRFTYKEDVTADKPFTIDGVVSYSLDPPETFLFENSRINACGNYEEGSWEYAITKVFNTVLMPNASCIVDKGDYQITLRELQLSITCDDMLRCGVYYIMLDVYFDLELSMPASWGFILPDDGSCVSSDSR